MNFEDTRDDRGEQVKAIYNGVTFHDGWFLDDNILPHVPIWETDFECF